MSEAPTAQWINVRLDADMLAVLKARAKRNERSLSAEVRIAIRELLEREES